jgi:hypothetical protein
MLPSPRPIREIRARFDERTLRVYQVYSTAIAEPPLKAQRFIPPFSVERMTWIKPSFTWMMYHSGWARKPGQERILAVDITREGFEWALAHSSLSHYDPLLYADRTAWETRLRQAPVRIQWDPERDLNLHPLPWRVIQVGLGPVASREYSSNWVHLISDITDLAQEIHAEILAGRFATGQALVGKEMPYPLPGDLARKLGCAVNTIGETHE